MGLEGTSSPLAPRGIVSTRRRCIRVFAVLLAIVAVAGVCILLQSWQGLGKAPAVEAQQRFHSSPQWQGERFVNPRPLWYDARRSWQRFLLEDNPHGSPSETLSSLRRGPSRAGVGPYDTPPVSGLRITWMGHSSLLVEIDGHNLLIDPVWGERTSPLPWLGPQRWYAPPVALDQLPAIDAVLISHDHYDHLDHTTLKQMKDWDILFIVPLGVGAHLRYWGIPDSRIRELDWWQNTRTGTLQITATPARHASGRLAADSNLTLWAGFALQGSTHRVYFSGDTGFFPELADIGERLGPFDVTLLDAGQYDPDWPDWHLGPEHTVQAHRLLRGDRLMPVHWGLFELAQHSWTEPIERVRAAAACFDIPVLMAPPGQALEPMLINQSPVWWPSVPWRTATQTPVIATLDGDPTVRVDPLVCPAS